MPRSPERLDLRRVLGDAGRIFLRDFPSLMAVTFLLRGPATFAAAQLAPLVAGRRLTAGLIPWAVDFVPFAIADGAIVWIGLRRLAGGRGPALGGAKGLALMAVAVLGVDLVENLPDLIQLLVPADWTTRIGAGWDVVVPIADAVWLALWLPALGAAVAERASGAASLGRSLDLTRGHRGTIAALTLGIQAIILTFDLILAYVLTTLGMGASPSWVIELAALPVWAFASVTQAAAYWELQRLKTGVTASAVAGLFD